MQARLRVLAALLAVPMGAMADCNHNNCLRAVIGDAFPDRNGPGDCSKYLQVTVTPATSTFYQTITIPTLVVDSTTVVSVTTGVTTVVASTETLSFEETSVVEETATETQVAVVTLTVDPNGNAARGLDKRQATASGSTFPSYATPCTSFAKYSSACSCLGYFADTMTVAAPSTTVTVLSTSTSTSTDVTSTSTTTTSPLSVTDTTLVTSTLTVSTTDATTTATSVQTAVVTNIVRNGKFDNGLSPWTLTHDSQIPASVQRVASPGPGQNFVLRTQNMVNNNLFEMRQAITGVSGQTYLCKYDWIFSNYYETLYNNRYTYVPYVHVYINNDIVDNQTPEPPKQAGVWYTSEFTFTSGGTDNLYFDCASPQARSGPGGGPNNLSLDNVSCIAQQVD